MSYDFETEFGIDANLLDVGFGDGAGMVIEEVPDDPNVKQLNLHYVGLQYALPVGTVQGTLKVFELEPVILLENVSETISSKTSVTANAGVGHNAFVSVALNMDVDRVVPTVIVSTSSVYASAGKSIGVVLGLTGKALFDIEVVLSYPRFGAKWISDPKRLL